MSFRIYFFCVLFLLTLSCRLNWDKDPSILNQSREAVDRDPQLALSLTDSALRDIRSGRLNDRFAVPVLLIRQQAFSRLRMMDSVLSVGVEIRELASSLGDSLSMAKSLLLIGGEVSMTDQHAFEPYLSGALSTFNKAGMMYEEALIESIIGGIGSRKGDFNASMNHLYRARDIMERLDSIRPLYAIYMNIGNNRSGMGDQRAAVEFYSLATGIARRFKDSVRIATALMNEGIAYSDMNIFDSSRMRFNEGLSSLPTQHGEMAALQILFNMATLSEKQGNLEKAVADYDRVVDGARKLGDPVAIGMANASIAVLMSKTGRLAPGIRLMEETIGKLDSIGFRHYDAAFTTELIQLYKMADRCTDALRASEYLKKLSDSTLSVENQQIVRELEAKYQTARKESENFKLRQHVRSRNQLAVGLIGTVAVLFTLIVILRQRNRYHRALNRTYERLLNDYRRQRDEDQLMVAPSDAGDAQDQPSQRHADTWEGEGAPIDADETGTSEEDMAIFDKLMVHLKTHRPHLDPAFKSDDIAHQLGISSRKLSQVIKLASGNSFTQFINRLRIDEATRLMERPNAGPLKIDAIASMCGFSNRQHFRRVFEQVTGVTPGYFRKSVDDPASE